MGQWYRDFLADLEKLLASGVPVLEALDTLASGKGGRRVLLAARLRREMQKGLALAEAMAAFPDQVPREHAAMIEAGERSGTLAVTLARLVKAIDERRAVLNELGLHLAYPLCLLGTSVVLLPLYLFILGRPWDYFLIQAAVFIPAGVIALIAWKGPAFAPRGSPARRRLEELLLSLPWLGSFLLERVMGSAFGLLGRLLGAGLPFADALPLTANAQSWDCLRAEILDVRARLEEEKDSVSGAARALRLFRQHPERLPRLAAGEKSGTLDRAFEELGADLEASYFRRLKRAFGVLGFLGIVIVGAIVLARGFQMLSGLYSSV